MTGCVAVGIWYNRGQSFWRDLANRACLGTQISRRTMRETSVSFRIAIGGARLGFRV
jgi:hypothetical protein